MATAFTPAPTFRQFQPAGSSQPTSQPQSAAATEELSTDFSISASSTDDEWKSEYESHVQSWRAESAEAREKAERERAKWEEIRAKEREEATHLAPKIEEVKSEVGALATELSPANTRDLVSGEKQVGSVFCDIDCNIC